MAEGCSRGVSKHLWQRIRSASDESQEFEVFITAKDIGDKPGIRQYLEQQERTIKEEREFFFLVDLSGREIETIASQFDVMILENTNTEVKIG